MGSNDQIITQAIALFHRLKQDMRLPRPGDIIAHPLDRYAYEVRSVGEDTITGFYVDQKGQEHVATFPLDEVFNPGAVEKLAQRIAQGEIDR